MGAILAEALTKGLSELEKFALEMTERQEKGLLGWVSTAECVVVPLSKTGRPWAGGG